MVYYKAEYRCPGQSKWTTIKDIKGDGIEQNLYRFIVLKDESIVCIPLTAEIMFSPKRAKSIQDDMSKESGQNIQRNE